MKTLDEAIEAFTTRIDAEDLKKTLRSALRSGDQLVLPKEKLELADRYESIKQEIDACKGVDDLADQIIVEIQEGVTCCVKHGLIRAFAWGVRIGMEMEKP